MAPPAPDSADLVKHVGENKCNPYCLTLTKSEDADGSVRFFYWMRGKKVTAHRTTLNKIIAECAKMGDAQAADYWFNQMTMMGLVPNRSTYCSIILACVKDGDLERAESWIIKLWKSGFTIPRGFCHLLVAPLMRSCDQESVDDVAKADFAASWLLRINQLGVPLNRSSINNLLLVYGRAGDIDRSEWWMSFMHEAQITPNKTTMSAIVMACKKIGDPARAHKWHDRMEELGLKFKDSTSNSDDNSEDWNDDNVEINPPKRGGASLRAIVSSFQLPVTEATV
mmetsp:Transcript_35173/g.98772  ORF Transcript_35173/g.98772 Transcript_35173/m.98772 type:complete len:282 (+) Transcript_35173:105-950(+)